MKKILTGYVFPILNAAILIISIGYMLQYKPSVTIMASANGWLTVRGLVMGWSMLMSILLYSNWIYIVESFILIKNTIMGINPKPVIKTYFSKISIINFILWCVIISQTMITFYIASHFTNGF